MDFVSISSVRAILAGFPAGPLLLFTILAVCSLVGGLIALYVALRMAVETWLRKRRKRLRRHARLAARRRHLGV